MKKILAKIVISFGFVSLACTSVASANISKDKYLVFSGAGVKGISYTSALGKLFGDNYKFEDINGFSGSSAGSIVSAMAAIGVSPKQMYKNLQKLDWKALQIPKVFDASKVNVDIMLKGIEQLKRDMQSINNSISAVHVIGNQTMNLGDVNFFNLKEVMQMFQYYQSQIQKLTTNLANLANNAPQKIENGVMVINQIFEMLKTFDHSKITQIKKNLDRLGLVDSNGIYEFVAKVIQEQTGNANYTFADLYKDRGKELYITSFDPSIDQTVIFDYKNTPNLPIAYAVLASSAVPFYFTAPGFTFDENNQYKYAGTSSIKDSNIFPLVDGGTKHNYPLDFMLKAKPNSEILGFVIVNGDHYDLMVNGKEKALTKHVNYYGNIGEFTLDILNSFLYDQYSIYYANKEYLQHSVVINAHDVATTDFNMTKETKQKLFDYGCDIASQIDTDIFKKNYPDIYSTYMEKSLDCNSLWREYQYNTQDTFY